MINNKYLNDIALVYKDTHILYKQFFTYVNNIAEELPKNAKIAICSDNSLEYIYTIYAAWLNNCIVIPIDAGASADYIDYILSDCKPDILFTTATLLTTLEESGAKNIPIAKLLDNLSYDKARENIITDFSIQKEDTILIIYTSGTTGRAKGVMLSNENIIVNINAVTESNKIITKEGTSLLLLPLHHVLPLAGALMAAIYVGGTVVVTPSMQPKDIKETLENNRINVIVGVPRFYELIYKGIKNKVDSSIIGRIMFGVAKLVNSKSFSKKIFKKVHDGLGNVDFMVCGGAALNTDAGNYYKTLGFEILEGYGMTEAAPMIAFTRPGRVLVGSPGEVVDGVQLKTIDGEIIVKGRNVMQAYYNKPEETAQTIRDGWLYTGDLGYLDDNGFLHITGRKKDIIVLSNGKNISPVEIELKLESETEAIKEAAVFLHEEHLHAVVVPNLEYFSAKEVRNIQSYFKEEIFPQFNKELSPYKRVMQFSLTQKKLPRTQMGKIQRFKLIDLIEKPKEKIEDKQLHCEEYQILKKFIESETSTTISSDDHIEYDIALDSLGKLGLIDFIERTFGVEINEEKLLSFPSIRFMADYIKDNKIRQTVESTDWTSTLKEKVNLKLPKSWPTMGIIKLSTKAFFKLYFKFKGEGYEQIPDGSCIIAPNHQSFFDGLYVAAFIRRRKMQSTYFYAKKKHIKNRFISFFAKRNNIIIVDLENGLKESIQKMAEVLRKGKNIIIFPEGTRTMTGELGEFKKMFAILSKELNVPVVPVAISGAFKALPRGKRFPRPVTKIKVSFLEAVYPENYTYEALVDKVHQMISTNLTR